MKRFLISFLILTLCCVSLSSADFAEELGVDALIPVSAPAEAEGWEAALYSGPTQQFMQSTQTALLLDQPFVLFGQEDCWAMAAQGTPESFGPVGWIEAASVSQIEDAPLLSFEDRLSVMVEDDTFLTDDPCGEGEAFLTLPAGSMVSLLAVWQEWGYVQYEEADQPIRGFLPLSAIL